MDGADARDEVGAPFDTEMLDYVEAVRQHDATR
jgi:hypothetical protein